MLAVEPRRPPAPREAATRDRREVVHRAQHPEPVHALQQAQRERCAADAAAREREADVRAASVGGSLAGRVACGPAGVDSTELRDVLAAHVTHLGRQGVESILSPRRASTLSRRSDEILDRRLDLVVDAHALHSISLTAPRSTPRSGYYSMAIRFWRRPTLIETLEEGGHRCRREPRIGQQRRRGGVGKRGARTQLADLTVALELALAQRLLGRRGRGGWPGLAGGCLLGPERRGDRDETPDGVRTGDVGPAQAAQMVGVVMDATVHDVQGGEVVAGRAGIVRVELDLGTEVTAA